VCPCSGSIFEAGDASPDRQAVYTRQAIFAWQLRTAPTSRQFARSAVRPLYASRDARSHLCGFRRERAKFAPPPLPGSTSSSGGGVEKASKAARWEGSAKLVLCVRMPSAGCVQ